MQAGVAEGDRHALEEGNLDLALVVGAAVPDSQVDLALVGPVDRERAGDDQLARAGVVAADHAKEGTLQFGHVLAVGQAGAAGQELDDLLGAWPGDAVARAGSQFDHRAAAARRRGADHPSAVQRGRVAKPPREGLGPALLDADRLVLVSEVAAGHEWPARRGLAVEDRRDPQAAIRDQLSLLALEGGALLESGDQGVEGLVDLFAAHVGGDLDSPHSPYAGGAVGPTQRPLAQLAVFDHRHDLLPHVQIDEVVADLIGELGQLVHPGPPRQIVDRGVLAQPVGLGEEVLGLLELDPQAAHEHAAGRDREVVGDVPVVGQAVEAGVVDAVDVADGESVVGGPMRAGQVGQRRAQVLGLEHRIFVPVGVEDRAALLHANACVMLAGLEQVTSDVLGGHVSSRCRSAGSRRRGETRRAWPAGRRV